MSPLPLNQVLGEDGLAIQNHLIISPICYRCEQILERQLYSKLHCIPLSPSSFESSKIMVSRDKNDIGGLLLENEFSHMLFVFMSNQFQTVVGFDLLDEFSASPLYPYPPVEMNVHVYPAVLQNSFAMHAKVIVLVLIDVQSLPSDLRLFQHHVPIYDLIRFINLVINELVWILAHHLAELLLLLFIFLRHFEHIDIVWLSC